MSQPVRTVAEFLKLNNIAYEHTPTDPLAQETKTPEFLAISPAGMVPAITHGAFNLSESYAIIQYIAETYSIDNNWWPADYKQKALVNCYLHWHHSNTRDCLYLMFYKVFIKKVRGVDPNPETVADLEVKTKRTLDFVEAILATGKFVARTTEISIADIAFYNDVVGLRMAEYDFGPYPNISRLMETIEALPAVQEVNAVGNEVLRKLREE